jgi:hypothetical protein
MIDDNVYKLVNTARFGSGALMGMAIVAWFLVQIHINENR